MREVVLLECECGSRNYSTTRNKKNISGKLTLKKFCRFCVSRKVHKEVKS